MRHPFDTEFGVQTSGLIDGVNLTSGHPHDRHNTAYFGVAPSVFRRLCNRWQNSPPECSLDSYSFVDIGAGMGRAMLLAAKMPFQEVVGVELNHELVQIAEQNIQSWAVSGRARCQMRILCQDATEFQFPSNPCVLFLFNPFGATVLRRLLKRIKEAFKDRPGQLDLLYVNHEHEALLKLSSGFARVWSGTIPKSASDEAADRRIIYNQPGDKYCPSEYESCSIYRWKGSRTICGGKGIQA